MENIFVLKKYVKTINIVISIGNFESILRVCIILRIQHTVWASQTLQGLSVATCHCQPYVIMLTPCHMSRAKQFQGMSSYINLNLFMTKDNRKLSSLRYLYRTATLMAAPPASPSTLTSSLLAGKTRISRGCRQRESEQLKDTMTICLPVSLMTLEWFVPMILQRPGTVKLKKRQAKSEMSLLSTARIG